MNIGFVNICHNDYVSEFAVNIAKKAVNNLKLMDISIFEFPEPIIDTFYAENAVRELVKQEIDGIIIFLGTWVECSVAMSLIRKIEHLPLCLWSFPMFIEQWRLNSTGSYVSFAMFKSTMGRVRYRYKPVLGLPDDFTVLEEIKSFCTAASCVKRFKRTRIGLIG